MARCLQACVLLANLAMASAQFSSIVCAYSFVDKCSLPPCLLKFDLVAHMHCNLAPWHYGSMALWHYRQYGTLWHTRALYGTLWGTLWHELICVHLGHPAAGQTSRPATASERIHIYLNIKIAKQKIMPVIMNPFCFVVLQSVGFHYNRWCIYIYI